MATVKIDFADLAKASSKAADVAKELETYARSLANGVGSAISGIEGGSSSYTSTVSKLAQEKAYNLRNRAMRYESLSQEISTFSDAAREADATVKAYLSNRAELQAENLTWLQKQGYALYKMFNGKFGNSELGAFLDNLLSGGGLVLDWGKKFVLDAIEWFKYGDGKYWLNIGLSVLGTIGAIIGAILSFPVSGVFAAIMAGLAIFGAGVSVINTIATVGHNKKALKYGATEPGVASYYGDTGSIADFAKKETTNKGLQDFAGFIDDAGKIAGILSFLGGGFMKTAADGTKMGTLDIFEIKNNFAGKFGFSLDFDTGRYSFDPGTIFDLGKEHSSWSKHVPWLHAVETIGHISGSGKDMLSTFKDVLGFDSSFQMSDLKDIVGLAGDMFPNLGGYDKVLGMVTSPPDPKSVAPALGVGLGGGGGRIW